MAQRRKKSSKDKLSFKEQFHALRYLPPLFKLIYETSPAYTLANIMLRMVQALLPLATLYVGKLIIDEVVRLYELSGGDMTYLWKVVALEFGLVIIAQILNQATSLLNKLLGDLFSNRISTQLIEHAATLDLYQFEDANFYDKLERARRQTTGRTILMFMVLLQIQNIITLVSLGIGLAAFNPYLLIILVVAVIPSFISESYFNQYTYSLTLSWTPERRELDYLRYIGASDEHAKEIKIFNLSDFIAKRFETIADGYYHANKEVAVKRSFWGGLLIILGTLSYYFAYVVIILQTVSGAITIGSLTFLSSSFSRMRNLLETIMTRFTSIADQAMYLQDLFDFLAIKPQISPNESGKLIPKIQKGITFENVSFQYPNSEKYAIKNLSFHLNPDEKLALVGENGAGKTTLVKLLARLYEPTEGRILLDGVDLKEFKLSNLRDNIGIIFQDFSRFHLKASENIAIGSIEEKENQPRIVDAAQKSLADAVVEDLPEKYNQILGKRFEKGIELSGGQWQKIALARAYMREAQILILDEPTAALDARAEHEVFLRFAELIQGKAAVLISHRFSTVRMADRILFLEHGQLLEIGSHEQLLEKDGKYAELFHLQAQGYQ